MADTVRPPIQELEAVMGELFRLFKESHTADMAILNLTPAQGFCLKVIGSSDSLTMGQLADYLALSSAAVTSQVDRLEANDWVVREPDDKDRRVTRVRLSEAGQAAYDRLRAHRCSQLERALQTLDHQEQQTLLSGLHLFVRALGQSLTT